MLTAALAFVVLARPSSTAGPVRTQIVGAPGAWRMLRGGKPYFVKGAGVGESTPDAFARLKAIGGNSVRTWGVGDDTGKLLDMAHKHGLTVQLGFWLGHKTHGFDWANREMVDKQFAAVRDGVRKYKNHPALLSYALGNEMEMTDDRDVVWQEIGKLAEMVKREDPLHPVGTVVAEIGGRKIDQMLQFAPQLDFLGINSYAGADTLPERLMKSAWKKPYLLTEYGPSGPWEVGKTSWGATLEPRSDEKARQYDARYQHAIANQPGRALGGYVFLWGHKMEETATWFGMQLPTGEDTQAVEVIARHYGKPRKTEVPRIGTLQWAEGEGVFAPGAPVKAQAAFSGRPGLKAEWVLREDGNPTTNNPNDPQASFKAVPGVASDTFIAPMKPGRYRLFLTVRDDRRGAAVANLPMLVK